MVKKNRNIIENYDKYETIIEGIKNAPISPITVRERKKNHQSSLYKSLNIAHKEISDEINLNIEIRDYNSSFSISFDSPSFPDCQLFRYDVGNGTHRNNFPEIPLSEQSVPTPHFHRYNNKGCYYAYKTDKLKNENESKALCDVEFGFSYFCQVTNVKYRDVDDPTISVNPEGELNLQVEESDPLENINFA